MSARGCIRAPTIHKKWQIQWREHVLVLAAHMPKSSVSHATNNYNSQTPAAVGVHAKSQGAKI